MAKLVFGMNQSLDGYVQHDAFAPDPILFRHFIAQTAALGGSLYGRTMYEIMRYWDDEDGSWDTDHRAFAEAWRSQHKWVVSKTLTSVGPNATLVGPAELEATARDLKERLRGDVDVCGTQLAASVGDLGLIDEYRLYIHPYVIGSGVPYFARARPPLRLTASERLGQEGGVMRLTYLPA